MNDNSWNRPLSRFESRINGLPTSSSPNETTVAKKVRHGNESQNASVGAVILVVTTFPNASMPQLSTRRVRLFHRLRHVSAPDAKRWTGFPSVPSSAKVKRPELGGSAR